jgi:protein required for attachment to host cells
MRRPLTMWIAVADGEHARVVQPNANNTLRTVQALDSASAHLRSRDIRFDQPGRPFDSASSAHHAVGRRHDLHVMEKDKFARFVAEQLGVASGRNEFDQLLLVAPTRCLHELREALDAGTAAKLVGVLEKDLVKTPDHILWPHVSEWVSAQRCASF